MSMRSCRIAALLVLVLLLGVGCARTSSGTGSVVVQDPLAKSGPEETVLRTFRLAGIAEGAVGTGPGAGAIVKLASLDSPAEAELAWQTALAALTVAYPRAREYSVRIDAPEPVLSVRVDGGRARHAVKSDDGASLERDAEFRLLPEGDDERSKPLAERSNWVATGSYGAERFASPLYLDGKNRVFLTGGVALLAARGAVGAEALSAAFAAARAAVPGLPAPGPGVGPEAIDRALRDRVTRALSDRADLPGASAWIADATSARSEHRPPSVETWRLRACVAEAVGEARYANVLALTAERARAVQESSLPPSIEGMQGAGLQAVAGTRPLKTEDEKLFALDTVVLRAAPGAAAAIGAVVNPGDLVLDTSVRGWGWSQTRLTWVDPSDPSKILRTEVYQ